MSGTSGTLQSLILLTIIGLSACKAIEPVTQQEQDKLKKFEAISENDVIQPVTFADLQNDDRVVTGTLSNGIRYYIMKNTRPESRAELRLVVKAGSIDEDHDQLGLAHFIEHMAFNGTRHFDKNELVNYLESVGSQFGPDLNAYTSFDETVYKLQVRTDDEEQLKTGLLVLSDWSCGLTFDEEEIDKERGVVIAEWRTRLSAAQRMQQTYLPTLLKGSRYAQRLPIGDPDIIQNADAETIKRFYYQWYRPDLMAVVAVGDFNVNLIEDYISESFSEVPKAINPRKKRTFNFASHDETLVKVCTDVEAPHTEVRVVNKMPHEVVKTIGDFRQRLISDLFVEMMKARYAELAQSEDAPFLYAGCYKGKNIGPMDAYMSFASAAEGEAMKALQSIIRENLRVERHGFNESEMERATANLLKRAKVAYEERDKSQSHSLARLYVQNFLTDAPFLSQASLYDLMNKYLPTIRITEVNARSKWFKPSDRVVIITGPEKEGLRMPTRTEVLEAFSEVGLEDIPPYVDHVSDGAILDLRPSAPVVKSRKLDKSSGVESLVLDNGATVLFKKTDFNNNEILFRATARGGSDCFAPESSIHASHAPWIIEDSGLGRFSAIDLKKKLTGRNIAITPYTGLLNRGLNGECGMEEAELLSQLIYLYFTAIREDSTAFRTFKEKMTAYYSNLLVDPSYHFHNEVSRITSNGNPARMIPKAENIDQLEMTTVYESFRRMFSDPSAFTFIFSGNLNSDIKEVLLAYIAAIPSGGETSGPVVDWDFIPDEGEYTWAIGEAPKTYLDVKYFVRPGNMDLAFKEDLSAFRRLAEIKLRESLREDNGGVYGVGTYASDKLLPDGYFLFGYTFNADPERADELIRAADHVMKTLSDSMPDASDIDKVIEITRQKFNRDVKENKYWQRKLVECVSEEYPFSILTHDHLEARLKRLTPERMQALGQLIYRNARVVSFRQNPE